MSNQGYLKVKHLTNLSVFIFFRDFGVFRACVLDRDQSTVGVCCSFISAIMTRIHINELWM